MRKLVRDKLPEIDPLMSVTQCEPHERLEWLVDKLHEEALEVAECDSHDQFVEELGDVWEVFKAIVNEAGLNMDTVLSGARKKRALKGGFEKGYIWYG